MDRDKEEGGGGAEEDGFQVDVAVGILPSSSLGESCCDNNGDSDRCAPMFKASTTTGTLPPEVTLLHPQYTTRIPSRDRACNLTISKLVTGKGSLKFHSLYSNSANPKTLAPARLPGRLKAKIDAWLLTLVEGRTAASEPL